MQDLATLRRTSVYSLRVAQDRAGADALLDLLAGIATEAGAIVTDTHAASQGGTTYVSISVRIPTSDADAIDLTGVLLKGADVAKREAYLHTGLGAHRRVIDLRWGGCGVAGCTDCLPLFDAANDPV